MHNRSGKILRRAHCTGSSVINTVPATGGASDRLKVVSIPYRDLDVLEQGA